MSQTALGVSFARHAVHIDKQDVAPRRRCACCPYPQSGPARFVTGCCLPLSWMCWKPSSGVVSAGGVIFGLAVLTILLGGLFYWGVEGQAECAALGIPFGQQTKWTYGNSLYFLFIALTTIGYGDFYPTTTGSKVFFIFHSTIGMAFVAAGMGYFGKTVVDRLSSTRHEAGAGLRRLGCPNGLVKFYAKRRVWIWIGLLYVCLLLIGGVLFGLGDPFPAPSYLNGVYFTFVTLATIGFGELTPSHLGTKLWAILFSIVGVAIFSLIISTVASYAHLRSVKLEEKSRPVARFRHASLRTVLDALDEAAAVSLTPIEQQLVLHHAQELWGREM